MPVNTLDPKSAPIVIDLQKGLVGLNAMTDMNADTRHNSIARIFPRLGETGTMQEIIELLNKR